MSIFKAAALSASLLLVTACSTMSGSDENGETKFAQVSLNLPHYHQHYTTCLQPNKYKISECGHLGFQCVNK